MAGHGTKGDFIGGTAYLMTFPDRGIVVAVMTNISFADTKSIALKIAEAFADRRKIREASQLVEAVHEPTLCVPRADRRVDNRADRSRRRAAACDQTVIPFRRHAAGLVASAEHAGRADVRDRWRPLDRCEVCQACHFPAVVLAPESAKGLAARLTLPYDKEIGLADLRSGSFKNSFMTPDGIHLNGNYVTFLRQMFLPAPACGRREKRMRL